MTDSRKIQYTSEGEQILVRPVRWGRVITQSIWVILVLIFLRQTAPAIEAYLDRRELTGALLYLEQAHLSQEIMLAVILAWCAFLAWWGIGGLIEIAKVFYYRDRFLLRSDALVVQRRRILTREIVLRAYEPMALRLRPLDGALEAETKTGTRLLTNGGTVEDRRWLLETLQQRYKTPVDLPATTANTRERIGTYIVEQRTDGSLRISSSVLSTLGCSVMAGALTIGFVGISIWLFSRASGGGIITLFFAVAFALITVFALNRRSVEASRRKLKVHWTSPAGALLRKFVDKDAMKQKFKFAEGEVETDTGMLALKTTNPSKGGSPTHKLLLLRKYAEEETEEEQLEEKDRWREDLVLDVYGHESGFAAEHLLNLLSNATGFEIKK